MTSMMYAPLVINGKVIVWSEHKAEPIAWYHLQEKSPGGEWKTIDSSTDRWEMKLKRDALRHIRQNMKELRDLGITVIHGPKRKILYEVDKVFKAYQIISESIERKDSNIERPLHPSLIKEKLKKEMKQHHQQQNSDIPGTL